MLILINEELNTKPCGTLNMISEYALYELITF